MSYIRSAGRSIHEMRPLCVRYNIYPYAAGSVLFEVGNTKVLISIVMQEGLPPFLRGKKQGWLTAEYALLPASTQTRTTRDISCKKSGRSVEIARFIGRSLRTVINFAILGERTIFVDCDILQADGSTRVAAITGAYLALRAAERYWLSEKIVMQPFLTDELMAVSVGWDSLASCALLDLDYKEDTLLDADFNFVLMRSERLVEIQGGGEKKALHWSEFEEIRRTALQGVAQLTAFYDANPPGRHNSMHETLFLGASRFNPQSSI